jgi:hypothetical protein
MTNSGNKSLIGRVEYPSRGKGPHDVGETFDMVVRKGPISMRQMMDQIFAYSHDDVVGHLEWLETHEFVTRREGDLDEDGTTEDLYEVHEKRIKE